MQKKRVHRDLSYTNVLLREGGGDTDEVQRTRDKLMGDYGLSEIDKMRRTFEYREGLLIDYDYAAELSQGDEEIEDEGGEDLVDYVRKGEDENENENEDEDEDKTMGHEGTRSTAQANHGENVTGVRTVRIF
jgi:hypothetical protein